MSGGRVIPVSLACAGAGGGSFVGIVLHAATERETTTATAIAVAPSGDRFVSTIRYPPDRIKAIGHRLIAQGLARILDCGIARSP